MPRKDLAARHVESLARGVEAVTIRSKVIHGPQAVIGRDVSTFLDADDIALMVSSLAAMPAFRRMFRAVADELDRHESGAADPAASLGSAEAACAVRRAAREAIGGRPVSAPTETIVGTHVIDGRAVNVVRITWRGEDGASYDLRDEATCECLTEDESFDSYPTDEQIASTVASHAEPTGNYCRFCGKDAGRDGHLIGPVPPGENPWCCAACWDPRLA